MMLRRPGGRGALGAGAAAALRRRRGASARPGPPRVSARAAASAGSAAAVIAGHVDHQRRVVEGAVHQRAHRDEVGLGPGLGVPPGHQHSAHPALDVVAEPAAEPGVGERAVAGRVERLDHQAGLARHLGEAPRGRAAARHQHGVSRRQPAGQRVAPGGGGRGADRGGGRPWR
jgi:hypothetical protein